MPQLSESTLRQQLADCHRMMVMAELLDYSGHVSARIPGTDRVLILPRDASRSGVTADDMLVVDLDGKVLDGNSLPPTETAIHLGVYRARTHDVKGHRGTMIGLFTGGLVIAGLFTLIPGRVLGNALLRLIQG